MNTKILKVAVLLAVALALIVFANPVTASQSTCNPVAIAKKAPCIQDQIARFQGGAYETWTQVNDYGTGTMEVAFYFEPMCIYDPVPCRIATQCVIATVDCNTRTAICL